MSTGGASKSFDGTCTSGSEVRGDVAASSVSDVLQPIEIMSKLRTIRRIGTSRHAGRYQNCAHRSRGTNMLVPILVSERESLLE